MPTVPQRFSLGHLLRFARELKGWSQTEAAARITRDYPRPLSQRTLSNYERNTQRPPLEMLIQLIRLYGCPPEILLLTWMLSSSQTQQSRV